MVSILTVFRVPIPLGRYLERLDKVEKKCENCAIQQLVSDVAALRGSFEMYVKLVERSAAQAAISPTTPELDDMLRRLMAGQLDESQERCLVAYVETHMSEVEPSKKLAIILTINHIKMRLGDRV